MSTSSRFRFRIRSLRTSIVLLVVGTVAALTLLVLYSVIWVTRQENERAINRDFQAANVILHESLEQRNESMQEVMRSLSGRTKTFVTYLMQGYRPEEPHSVIYWNTVSDVAGEAKSIMNADDVVITDRRGRILGESSGKVADWGTSTANQLGVAAVLSGQKTWVGVVGHPRRLAIETTVSVSSPNGKYLQGTVSEFTYIGTPLAQTIARALNCQIVLMVNGRAVGQSAPFENIPVLMPRADSGVLAPPFVVQSRGRRYVGSYQNLRLQPGDPPIGVLILRPYEEVTALSRSLEESLIVPVAVALLLALLIAAAVAGRVTTPLDGVVQAARELREGRWPKRFEVDRADEIGLLQNVFNEMTLSLRASQERLLALIDTDPLTELDNHRRFQERLAQEVKRAAAMGEPLSLLLIDLDHFQAFNQNFGHGRGDEILKAVAARLVASLPALGLAARYGGEEFALLVPQLRGTEAALLAERLRAAIEGDHLPLTVSVGYAELDRGVAEPESLTLAAELALTQAKQLGRNRVCGFDAAAFESAASPAAPIDAVSLNRFLRDGSLATIQALAAAVDAKDPYTQGHSRRVADLALQMARRIGLSAEEAYLVFTTGTLHDVGKIGVPDRILQKPGRLDDEERRLMETHPVLGAVIVAKAPQLAHALPGVRSHHERWDGGGYPDGLREAAIPLSARILALADTYDAMTSDRPYRTGLPTEIALGEIARNAGGQFDPELAPVFVTMVQEIACSH